MTIFKKTTAQKKQDEPEERNLIMHSAQMGRYQYLDPKLFGVLRSANLEYADDVITILQASPLFLERVAAVKRETIEHLTKQLNEAVKSL